MTSLRKTQEFVFLFLLASHLSRMSNSGRRFALIPPLAAIRAILLALFLSALGGEFAHAGQLINVREGGAVGDGLTLDTAAIQRAIDTCSTAGGGTVTFPPGRYLIGTIYLKSNLVLDISAGAEIVGTTQLAQYATDTGVSPYYPEYLDQCLIYAHNAQNITITGQGAINGGFAQGQKPVPAPQANDRDKLERPMLLRFDGCDHIQIDSLKLYGSCSWCLHFARSKNITLKNLDVPNKRQDGVDFESCEDAAVSGCHFVTGDDSIAILASHNQACRRITISDCIMQSSCAAIRLGPLSYGDIQDVTATRCHFSDCGLGGIKIGMYEGGTISRCNFSDIQMDQVTCPILIFLGSFYEVGAITNRRPQMPIGQIHDLVFQDITATVISRSPTYPDANSVMFFQGYPGTDLQNITLQNIHMTFPGGGTQQQASRSNIVDMDKIDPLKDGYWTDHKGTFGDAPASALYARHVQGLKLIDVAFTITTPDARAAIFLNQSSAADITGLQISCVSGDPTAVASILAQNSHDLQILHATGNPFASSFLAAVGDQTKAITLKDVHPDGPRTVTTSANAQISEIHF